MEWQGCAQNNNYFEIELSDFVVILVYTHYKQFKISLVLHDIKSGNTKFKLYVNHTDKFKVLFDCVSEESGFSNFGRHQYTFCHLILD